MENALPLTINPFYNFEYNNTRRLKAILISSVLNNYQEFSILPYMEQMEIIITLENSCSNESIRKSRDYNLRCVWDNNQFVDIYHSICYNIISILDKENNTLFKKIMDKSIDLNTIANMSCKELSPEKYDDLSKQIDRRVNTSLGVKYTELYFCYKCKRNKTTAERVQNRSNDESSSFYITCLFCGTKWFK
jgi:DNA-directed RNA polymerase subunit M/transcription elongation factor TFIIS